jgi:5'-methylthioadenosine phosphorylase
MGQETVQLAVIGGSGLYNMPQLEDIEERVVDTPFGRPSDSIILGTLEGVRTAFLPRHGRGHVYLPSEVPYRANIYALKMLGVERIIAISACGSLREDYQPGHIVIPDQLFDNTRRRTSTFFGEGLGAHISIAEPFCSDLGGVVSKAVAEAGGNVHTRGTYITIEGPRFSTRGESHTFRSWGMSVIGMTTSPEAFLAREAEICYAVMAHVTDYDVWHESEEPVTVDMVVKTLNQNLLLAQDAIRRTAAGLRGKPRTCECQHALAAAFITDRRKIPPATISRLNLLVGKYLD